MRQQNSRLISIEIEVGLQKMIVTLMAVIFMCIVRYDFA